MTWWEPRELERGREFEVRLGLLQLRVARDAGRLRLGWHHLEGEEQSEAEFGEPQEIRPPEVDWTVHRYAVDGGGTSVTLTPRLAPSPVVARPEVPFTVAPGSSVTVYVGTPLWVAILSGSVELAEIGAVPPKNTWFGTPVEGERCIAMRSHLRMSLDDVIPRQHRAIAPVTIRNQGPDPLHIERLWLPVHNLALGVDAHGRFQTQPVELIRREGQDEAERRIGDAPAGEVVAAPRSIPEDNPVARVFNSVFR